MVIDDSQRIQILLKLVEQNAKAVEWVKELDFKIAYQTLFLYAAIVAFAATGTRSNPVRCVLFATVLVVAFAATLFLVRNHCRHLALIEEDQRVRKRSNSRRKEHICPRSRYHRRREPTSPSTLAALSTSSL